jgi:hypothetical protein
MIQGVVIKHRLCIEFILLVGPHTGDRKLFNACVIS